MGAHTNRLDRLDDLRFLACFMVLVFHMPFYPPDGVVKLLIPQLAFLKEGHSGVAFFCTISGFIFTWLYYDSDIPYKEFVKRRLLRIFPLFIFVAFLGYVLDGTWSPGQLLASFTTLRTGPYVGLAAPAWSVLLELQFYLLFPIMVLLSKRYGWSYLALLIVMFIGLRWMVWLGHGKVRDVSYWTLYGRTDQFLAGMLTAMLVKHISKKELSSLVSWVAIAAGATIITLALMKLNQKGGYLGAENKQIWIFLPTLEAIGYSLITGGYILRPKTMQRGRIGQCASYLGRISYSTYLTHAFVIFTMYKIPIAPPTYELAILYYLSVVFPVIILVSMATYNLIEKPFLELRSPRPETKPSLVPVLREAMVANPPVPFKLRS